MAEGWRLVAVVAGLVRTVDRDIEILGLDVGELGELDVEIRQVKTGDLLVELLGQHAAEIGSGQKEGIL